MQVAEQFKSANFADLDIAASALYLLAALSTPEEAREEAITRAQAGERISVSSARDLRDKYIPSKPASESQPALGLQTELPRQETQPKPEAQEEPPQPRVQFPSQPATQYLPRVEPTSPPPAPTKRRRAKEHRTIVVAPKQVAPGEWWKLGSDHYLFCGNPASTEFQKNLPETVALSLAFPSRADWHLNSLPFKTTSSLALHTLYEEDQDLRYFRAMVENALQLYTEGEDANHPVA